MSTHQKVAKAEQPRPELRSHTGDALKTNPHLNEPFLGKWAAEQSHLAFLGWRGDSKLGPWISAGLQKGGGTSLLQLPLPSPPRCFLQFVSINGQEMFVCLHDSWLKYARERLIKKALSAYNALRWGTGWQLLLRH